MSKLKNFVIKISSAEPPASRIVLRDSILAAGQVVEGENFKVIDAPEDIPIALVSCTEKFSSELSRQFPNAVISAECVHEHPRPNRPKPPRRPGP